MSNVDKIDKMILDHRCKCGHCDSCAVFSILDSQIKELKETIEDYKNRFRVIENLSKEIGNE